MWSQTKILCVAADCSMRVTMDNHTQCSAHFFAFSQAVYDPLACSVCQACEQEFLAASEVHVKLPTSLT